MAIDVRNDFKCLDDDQQLRFIEAVKWMKTHAADGTVNASGGSYQKYVDWHADMRRVNIAEKHDYSATTAGVLLPDDDFISIRIDGMDNVPQSGIWMSQRAALEGYLNGLVAHKLGGGTPHSILRDPPPAPPLPIDRIGEFSVSLIAGNIQIDCNDSPYIIENFRCQISGATTTFTFTQGPKTGDYQMSNMSSAHFGSLFLPWHRAFIRLFELDLQKADEQRLEDTLGSAAAKDEYIEDKGNLGLPYWNWTKDNSTDPSSSRGYLWKDTLLGGNGNPADDNKLETGPFAHGPWPLLRRSGVTHVPASPPYLRREIASIDYPTLPTEDHVDDAWDLTTFDVYEYNEESSASSFRNMLEGWVTISGSTNRIEMHNLVHMWVGGTMAAVPRAPNDPVFFLHHCNVDRLWAKWQKKHNRVTQYPEYGPVPGRRLNDEMLPWVTGSTVGAIKASEVIRWQQLPASIQPILGEGYKYDCESTVKFS